MPKVIKLTRTRGKETRTVEIEASREGTINVLKNGGFKEVTPKRKPRKPKKPKGDGGENPQLPLE